MPEDLKEKIYSFLKENAGERFSMTQLKEKTGISYPSVLKWIEVLLAEKDRDPIVKIEDYGHLRLVWG